MHVRASSRLVGPRGGGESWKQAEGKLETCRGKPGGGAPSWAPRLRKLNLRTLGEVSVQTRGKARLRNEEKRPHAPPAVEARQAPLGRV